jgi:hypothetical protein
MVSSTPAWVWRGGAGKSVLLQHHFLDVWNLEACGGTINRRQVSCRSAGESALLEPRFLVAEISSKAVVPYTSACP